MSDLNQGFDPQEIQDLKEEISKSGQNYLSIESEDNGDEYQNFQFIGKFEGKEVIYDAAIYTLRLLHNSEIYDLAEHEAAKKFPGYRKIDYEEDENGDILPLDDMEEEIGLFIAEVMDDLEEEESVKVKERLELDDKLDYGIGLDVALNVETVDNEVIEKFIKEYNSGSLKLDPTLYSFQLDDDDEE